MKKYTIIKTLGEGSFAKVQKAQNQQTGEIVAVKQMKQSYRNWEECLKLRELKALQKLKDNPNIIKLREIVQVDDKLNFIFEYVEINVWEYYNEQKKEGKPLNNDTIKSIFYQIASAIKYMHSQQFFHRDLKPENLLISKSGVIKLIDFGLAREIRSRPPFTDYVSTRWYRAPELLLRSASYNSPVDIFALGLIMAELFEGKPLCQGTSDIDQLSKLCGILGTPTKEEWSDGYILANQRGFNFRNIQAIPLDQVLPNIPYDALQLIQQCLKWDPSKRPTINKILQDPYFNDVKSVLPPDLGMPSSTTGQKSNSNLTQKIKAPIQQEEFKENTQFKQKQQQQQQQQQQQKPLKQDPLELQTRKSINLDDIDSMLQEVEKSEKLTQSGLHQKKISDYAHAHSNPGLYSQPNDQYNYQSNSKFEPTSYAKDRQNRPNSLQGVHALNFQGGNQQQQSHHMHQSSSYSPDKKKYGFSSNNIDLHDKNDDILGSILNNKTNNTSSHQQDMFSSDYKF